MEVADVTGELPDIPISGSIKKPAVQADFFCYKVFLNTKLT